MSLSEPEFQEFLAAIDRSISHFGGRPSEPGADLQLYEALQRIREAMIRARRDFRDPNIVPNVPPAPSA
jgi:hypothetical protein